MKTYAIIPAGGKGLRSGFTAPKQYLKFNKKELIVYTLEIFQANKLVDEIIVSAEPAFFSLLNKLKKKYDLVKITQIVEGGKERQDSVYNALKVIDADKNDLVIVHDAARPFLSTEVLKGAIEHAKKKGNAVVSILAKDTLVRGRGKIESYINRDEVHYVQTPQIFKFRDLMKAMELAYRENFYGTDESILVHRIGKTVHLVEGSLVNFKVTTKADIKLLKFLLK